VELGTIIIAGASHPKMPGHLLPCAARQGHTFAPSSSYPAAFWDVLGKSVLQRSVEQLRDAGSQLVSVVSSKTDDAADEGAEQWERAFFDLVRNGAERVLVISAGIYNEVDIHEFVSFHLANRSNVSNVLDERGPLGISLIEAKCADGDLRLFRNRLAAFSSCSSSYEFDGYCNRLTDPSGYRALVRDALWGRCRLKPDGREVSPGVWCASGARVSASAQIVGPAYVGLRARVRAGALIAPGTAIEQRSEVDCGTVVENSSILPRSYLGPGLHVSQSVVSGSRLFHLTRNIDVELAETGLLGRKGPSTRMRVLESLGSLLGGFGITSSVGASTSSRTPASVDWARSNGFFD
jgi:hypothetical protein